MIAGCADSHKLTRIGTTSVPLSPGASAYVALPTDGRYGEISYASSGAQTAREVGAAFAPYVSKIAIATAGEDVATATGSAAADGYDYLLYPQILHWEDRATEWSGKSDRVTVKLSVMQTDTGDVLDSGVIEGTSGLATFGGDHPQDLLAQPLREYAATLFGRR